MGSRVQNVVNHVGLFLLAFSTNSAYTADIFHFGITGIQSEIAINFSCMWN
jgi:hypothetical protein